MGAHHSCPTVRRPTVTRHERSRYRGDANRNVVRLKTQRAARRDSREDAHSIGASHCPFAPGASCPGGEHLCALCADIPHRFGA
jgi:hypothetical protein